MTLRLRLTIFYATVLGGVLLLLVAAIFTRVSTFLINQVDQNLEQTAADVTRLGMIEPGGQFSLESQLSINPNVVIQVWDTRRELIATTQTFNPQSTIVFPIYPQGFESMEATKTSLQIGGAHIRVLSVPIEENGEILGILQAASDLKPVDDVIQDLSRFLVITGFSALSVALLLGYLAIRRALAPLELITDAAMQITRADDLSRRIPEQEAISSEVADLISSINQTLARMENLFQSQKRFIADVSHELRTPLTVIKGNLDLAYRLDELDWDILKSVGDEVDRITRLVEDLLLLAQAGTGRLELDLRTVELDTLLLEVFKHGEVLAAGKVTFRIQEIDQIHIPADRDRLKQVMLNLLANAVNYSPIGGEVVFRLYAEGSSAVIEVIDQGAGIPPEDLPHIFKRFYRGEKSRARSKDGKGFGLGLPIAQMIANSHGGRIEAHSAQGAGAAFRLILPIAPAQPQQSLS